MSLSPEDKLRYARHLSLPYFGVKAQEKLKASKVLIVGTGGLGASLLQYLTAAGLGTIGVLDFDTVEVSNLQRQVLFGPSDVGKAKTEVAIRYLQNQNPNVHFNEHHVKLDSSNAMEIFKLYDVVVDGSDNFPTRYLVNDACVLLHKPLVYGSIFQFEGQVSVFNYQGGPNYRDLYPSPPPPGMVPSCAEGGVLGVLPGVIGSMQASETIKIVAEIGETLSGRLFLFDALDFSTRIVNIQKDTKNPLDGDHPTIHELIDYDEFCGPKAPSTTLNSITVHELREWLTAKKDFTLIDVRESYEYEVANLNCQNLSLYEIPNRLEEIPKEKPVVLYCKTGSRSAKAYKVLGQNGFENQLTLKGGISAWRDAFDAELEIS